MMLDRLWSVRLTELGVLEFRSGSALRQGALLRTCEVRDRVLFAGCDAYCLPSFSWPFLKIHTSDLLSALNTAH